MGAVSSTRAARPRVYSLKPFSALGFQEPKDDPVGPTGQENNDDAAIYGLLSTS